MRRTSETTPLNLADEPKDEFLFVPSVVELSDSLHGLAKEQSRRPFDFLSGHAYQDGR